MNWNLALGVGSGIALGCFIGYDIGKSIEKRKQSPLREFKHRYKQWAYKQEAEANQDKVKIAVLWGERLGLIEGVYVSALINGYEDKYQAKLRSDGRVDIIKPGRWKKPESVSLDHFARCWHASKYQA